MKYALTFIFGMAFGILFQHDLPILKDINHAKVRYHTKELFDSLAGK